jgi:hypothetical protein
MGRGGELGGGGWQFVDEWTGPEERRTRVREKRKEKYGVENGKWGLLFNDRWGIFVLFVWLISHLPAVLFSQNKSATNNQPAVLFSQNISAPAISHQPNEKAD